MKVAPLPENEASRLAELRRYNILDTPPEEAFDDLTAIAAQICGTPIALVSLVDAHRQWFKAKVGLDAPETPRDMAFCAHAIHQSDIMVVSDTSLDERFADNPLVVQDPSIRFYAGMPLIMTTGHAVGTLCVIDRIPHDLTQAQQEALRKLGRQVVRLMELRLYHDEHKQAETKQAESAALLRRVQTGLLELATDTDMYHRPVAEAFQVIAAVSAKSLQVHRSSIWFFTDDHAAIRCAELYERPLDRHSSGIELLAAACPRYFAELRTGRVIAAGDAQTDPRTAEFGPTYLIPLGISSMLDVPIRSEGRLIGVICHEHVGPPREWTVEEEQFAASAANTVSLVLEAADRHQAEEALKRNEERTRQIIDTALDAVVSMDRDGVVTGWNRQATLMFGWTAQEIVGHTLCQAIIPPQYRDRHRQGVVRFLETGRGRVLNRRIEITALRRDGAEFPIELAITPIHHDNAYSFTAFISDISERKRAQRQMEETQQFLTSMIEHLPIMVFVKNAADLTFERWNRAAEEVTGFSRDEMLGKCDYDFFVKEEADFFTAKDREVIANGTLLDIPEEAIHTKHRGIRILRTKKLPIMDERGQPRFLLGIAEDITERKEAEAALRESEEKYRGLFEWSRDAIMTLFPPDWKFSACNSATLELFGAERVVQFTSLGPGDVSPPHQPDGESSRLKAPAMIERAMQEGSHFFEWTHRKLDGSEFLATVLLTRITLHGQTGLQATVRDITQQKQAEQALREQMRLSALAADVNSALVQSTTLPAMLQDCTTALIRHADAAFARIWLINPGDLCGECHHASACADRRRCLHLAASAGLSTNLNGQFRRVPLGALKIGKIAQGWGAMTTNDALTDDRLPNKSWLRDNRLQAFAGYPLTVGNEVVGVLALFSRHRLSDPMLNALERIAQVISIGVERKRTEGALRASEERLALTVEGSNIGIWDWNLNTNAAFFSLQWKRQLGYEDSEIVNTIAEWQSRLHPDDRDGVLHRIQSFISGGSARFEFECRLRHKGGAYRWVLSRGALIRDVYGIASRMVGIHIDKTTAKQAEEDLRRAKESAEAASVAKSQFLANMSHEIRTPMNGVLGMTELMLGTPLSDRQRHLAETVHRSATALLDIINDILDFSKIEAGKLHLEQVDFDLHRLCEDVADLFAEPVRRKALELICRIGDAVPARLNGDPLRLRQILINLLSNAVKFTERGEIVLLVDVVETRPQEALLRFHVKDSGIGIPPDAQQRIFKAFDQADSSTTRKYGGTGLGLAIVNRLVELMGGVIGVDSAPGEGSTFWFVIRLGMGAQPPTTVGPFLQGRRLLIVDDNETNRVIVAHHVHRWGADAACAASASEALALLHQAVDEHRPYDAAILDMQMPGMDGLALATAIQSGRYLSAIRLLMLTSLGDQGPAAAAAGIRRTLTKPVSHTRLREALMTLFDAEPAGVAPDAAAERPASTSGSVLLAEDNAVNREVALGMLEMLGYRVQAVENGRLAVQAATAHRFDLVLMDCQMPEMDGFEATRLIREREASLVQPDGKDERRTTTGEGRVTPHVPIVALTANAMQGDREACLDAGMDAYLSKPFTLQQLQAVLAHWLDPRSTSTTPDHRPNPSDTPTDKNRPPAPDGLALVDREAWKAVTAIQRPSQSDLLARILGLYLKDSQGLVDKIAEAVGRGDSRQLLESAHSLKSRSATLGAHRLADLCRQLELLGRNGHCAQAQALLPPLRETFQQTCALFRREWEKRAA